MKPKITSLACALAVGAAALFADAPANAQPVPPTYVTQTASGTTTSSVYFATSPSQQMRIVSAFATSDLSTSNIKFYSGGTAATCAYTNLAAQKQFGVSRTNGFNVGDYVIVETQSGQITNAQITAFTAATNIIFADKIMDTVPGDQIYDISGATAGATIKVGATSITQSGDAIFVGNRGRPVWVRLNGTSACSLDAITGRYE